jgi:hypothetical protein
MVRKSYPAWSATDRIDQQNVANQEGKQSGFSDRSNGGHVRLDRGDSPNHGLVRTIMDGFEVPGIYDFPASRILTSALPCSVNE